MAPPAAPYCSTMNVALFLTMMRGGQPVDFGSNTIPSKDVVEQLIDSVASRIDMAYMSVGYRIPFEAKSGEAWPAAQTEFLKFLNTIGVAAYMGGNVATPPVTAPGRPQGSGSLYWDEWSGSLKDIALVGVFSGEPSRALLRANTYPNTGAEWRLSVSRPATTNFSEGYYDPTAYDLMRAFTDRTRAWYKAMLLIAQESPDFMYSGRGS